MGRIDLVTRFLISMVAPLSRRSPKPCAKSLVKPGVLSQAGRLTGQQARQSGSDKPRGRARTLRTRGKHVSRSELPQVMIDVEIRIAHALWPRHLPPHCVRREFALVDTKSLKQVAKLCKVRSKLYGWGAALILIHLGRCLEAVRPANRSPQSEVFEYRPLEKTGRRANVFLSERSSQGIV